MNKIKVFRHPKCEYSIDEQISGDDGRTYIVGDRIAAGGNAVVHECIEKIGGDNYAVKFQLEFRSNRRERFQREIELLRAFDDPHIIEFVAQGSTPGLKIERNFRKGGSTGGKTAKQIDIPFVILKKASQNLAELAKSPNQIPSATYLAQFLGLSKALVKVNEKALHRDIKPENILVVGDVWAISDFGLCDVYVGPDLSNDHEKIGPALWMSPEALNKKLGCQDSINQSSDVFQLASVFWYATCGRHPTGVVRYSDWQGPTGLFRILRKALLHCNESRFQTSAEFYAALEAEIYR